MMWVYHKLGIMIDQILCTRGILKKNKNQRGKMAFLGILIKKDNSIREILLSAFWNDCYLEDYPYIAKPNTRMTPLKENQYIQIHISKKSNTNFFYKESTIFCLNSNSMYETLVCPKFPGYSLQE